MKNLVFILFYIFFVQLSAQSVYVEDRKIFVDDQEYRINGICYARGEGNGENSGYTFNDDIPLLVDANINTIRTYAAITNSVELNAFANAGIKVIMMLNENSYTWYVNQYKNHPAILMWEFGNEFNYHPEWFGNNIQNWYNVLENCASTVKSIDPNHPVSTGHGEVPTTQALTSCPSVDVWGMNIYRWLSPDSAINELAAQTDEAMYISEAGADSYNSNSGSENQAQRAQATEIILNAIIEKSDLCVGVTLFEFCDEWWKAGDPNQQDVGGFSNAIPYDNYANEEYWGIVTRNREPKQSYYVVQAIYESTSLSLSDNNFHVSIYPNPVSDGIINLINPTNEALAVEIFDLNGRKVISKTSIFDSVDVSELSEGIYSMKLSNQDKFDVKKIVVK